MMSRLDDPAIYDPFWCRLADLADPATTDQRRRELYEELVVWEAEEIAHGHRHLTITHSQPDNLAHSRHLDTFYDQIRRLIADAGWVRVRGTGDYVTVTVGGDHADTRIDTITAAAQAANPGHWIIAATPLSATGSHLLTGQLHAECRLAGSNVEWPYRCSGAAAALPDARPANGTGQARPSSGRALAAQPAARRAVSLW